MSALPPIADIDWDHANVCFVPIADMLTGSGQSTVGKKSSPSQGKIKGFFKIAGSPVATASAQC
jgi:hypothetical protein